MKKYILIMLSLFFLRLSAQTITSISPNSGNVGQTLTVTITGNNTHFNSGSGTFADFEFSQGSSVVNFYNVSSWTSMTVNFTIPPGITSGYYDFYTSNSFDGFMFADKGFYVNGTSPSISISPNAANPGQTLNINITGTNTHFQQSSGIGAYIDFTPGAGFVSANNYIVSNDLLMAANFTVPPGTQTAYYTLYCYDGFGFYPAPNAFGVPATIGIGEVKNALEDITVSPNPFTDVVTFHAKVSHSITSVLEIYNVNGEKVFEEKFNKLPAGNFEYTLRSADFKNNLGIYFANWKTGNSSSTIKLFFIR